MKELFQNTVSNIVAGAVAEGRDLYVAGKNGVIQIAELVQEQAPELVKEIIVYHRGIYIKVCFGLSCTSRTGVWYL